MFPCAASFDVGNDLAFSFSSLQSLIETSQSSGVKNINLTTEEQTLCRFGGNDLDDEVRGSGSGTDPILVSSEDQLFALDPFNELVRTIGERSLSYAGIGRPILGSKIAQLVGRIDRPNRNEV